MAEIVLGIGASHTTLMNTHWQQVDHLARAHGFRDALGDAKGRLVAAEPDLAIIVGSNHFRGLWLDLMPPFLLGVDVVEAAGEHGTPRGPLPSWPSAALFLHEGLSAAGFDLAFSTQLTVDHGVSHAVQWLLDGTVPVLPLVVNCFAPPLPKLARVLALGAALGAAIRRLPECRRVAVIASGGLSHALPFPDWRFPQSEADRFFVDSWRNGRGRWQDYEAKRRKLVAKARPAINEPFDRSFLRQLRDGRIADFVAQTSDEDLVAQAGNGGNELRTWLLLVAALNFAPAEILNYAPMPEWLTGMAVAVIHPHRQPAAEQNAKGEQP